MNDSTAAIAFEEAKRGILEQEQRLEAVRSRAGFLFAANAVATSFLGSLAFLPPASIPSLVAASSAAVLFAIDALITLSLLVPIRNWKSKFDAGILVTNWVDDPAKPTAEAMQRDLAIYLANNLLANEPRLERVFDLLNLAIGLAALEIILWLAAVALG
jgi:hypothetical protein